MSEQDRSSKIERMFSCVETDPELAKRAYDIYLAIINKKGQYDAASWMGYVQRATYMQSHGMEVEPGYMEELQQKGGLSDDEWQTLVAACTG